MTHDLPKQDTSRTEFRTWLARNYPPQSKKLWDSMPRVSYRRKHNLAQQLHLNRRIQSFDELVKTFSLEVIYVKSTEETKQARGCALLDQTDPDILKFWEAMQSAWPRRRGSKPRRSFLIGDKKGTKTKKWLELDADKSYLILDAENHQVVMFVIRKAISSDRVVMAASDIVDEATGCRRDLRPYEPGRIVAFGHSAGRRDARVFGNVKNIIKGKSDTVRVHGMNCNALGVASLLWAVVESIVPTDITKDFLDQLDAVNLPPIGADTIDPKGTGYEIKLGMEAYHFPLASRSPPEAYFTRGYSSAGHTDDSIAPFTFGFGLRREISSPADSWKVGLSQRACEALATKLPETIPARPSGGDFVNLKYQIICRNSENLLIMFRPNHLHGSTVPFGATTRSVAFTASRHIIKAWEKSQICTIDRLEGSNAVFSDTDLCD
ncbi:hypothetical protein DL93DRAFT_2173523 [Clavulina sp. PMI_390]|nr:hypothetical protein DL93DRAFT_2173523 [Clavulina sp. PMI_390]